MKFAWTTETKRDKAAIELAKRVERWGNDLAALGVAHYIIDAVHVVEETPGGPQAQATVQASRAYDHCVFSFKREYLDTCTADDLDQTILHEWVHVAMRDLDRALTVVEKWMPEATYSDFEDVIDSEREGLVDRMAHALFFAFRGRKPQMSA